MRLSFLIQSQMKELTIPKTAAAACKCEGNYSRLLRERERERGGGREERRGKRKCPGEIIVRGGGGFPNVRGFNLVSPPCPCSQAAVELSFFFHGKNDKFRVLKW